jgi:hypothetical protein
MAEITQAQAAHEGSAGLLVEACQFQSSNLAPASTPQRVPDSPREIHFLRSPCSPLSNEQVGPERLCLVVE